MPDIVDMLHELPHAITPGPAGPDTVAADVARGHRALRQRRGYRLAGAAGVAAAGALAVVLALPSAPPPTSVADPAGSAKPHAVDSPLVTLAAHISASAGSQRGDASLQIVTQTIGGKVMQVYYGLYTNSGQLYSGDDKPTLIRAIAHHSNQADGTDVREVDAARYAVTGNLAQARVRMVNATPNDFFYSLAKRKKIWAAGAKARRALLREKGVKNIKKLMKMPTGKALADEISNSLWTNSTDALNWAGGDSEIRAGVLRLLSTIPDVTVTKSTTHGLPTLTITAGPAVFGGSGREVLTVNATSGLPVKSVSSTPGVPDGVETYQVSRVTLAAVKAGKF